MHERGATRAVRRGVMFVLGGPSVGKTTVALEAMRLLSLRAEDILSMDQIHREMSRRNLLSARFQYREDGSLVLLDRESEMLRALTVIAIRVRGRRRSEKLPLIAEISHPDYNKVFNLIEWNRSTDLALEVESSMEVALRRNSLRNAKDQVPVDYFDLYRRSEPRVPLHVRRRANIWNGGDVGLEDLRTAVELVLTRWEEECGDATHG